MFYQWRDVVSGAEREREREREEDRDREERERRGREEMKDFVCAS